MVVKVALSVLKNFNENSENENTTKPLKLGRKNPPKLQRKSKILVPQSNSPSKAPLTSSSLANINNASPLKHSQQTILPQTPIKQEIKYEECPFESPPSVSSSCSSSVSPNSNLSPEFQQETGTFIGRSINTGDDNSSCRNRLSTHSATNDQQQKPPPLSRRNARERNRVKQVSMGFSLLRQHVPQINRKKKLSKVETLRGAVDYIRGLEALLQEHPQPVVHHTNSQKNLPQKYLTEQGSNQFIQVPPQSPAGGGVAPLPSYALQNLRGNSISLQQEGQSSFYDDRIHQFQMSNSCLEPQILKVPKMEDQYHCSPIYSSSVYNVPSMNYCKSYDGSHTMESLSPLQDGKEYIASPLQDSKGHLVAIVQGIQECPQSGLATIVTKDPGEIELLEALAWWQHNS